MARRKNDSRISGDKNSNGAEVGNGPKYKFPPEVRYRLCPRSDQEIDMITDDLLLYAEQPDSYSFEGFIKISGLSNSRLYDYARKSARLAEAMLIAKQLIGCRREVGALENKLNAAVHMGTYGLYNPDYRALRKELSSKEGTGEGIKVNVVMERYPETEVVPLKEEKND